MKYLTLENENTLAEIDINRVLNSQNSICLASIQKSGTHWFRYLFANYYQILDGKSDRPITYNEMQYSLFPNNREYIREGKRKYVKPNHELYKYGFDDFYWQHRMHDFDDFEGKIIFLYRNPLDYLVSRYFYAESLYQKYQDPSDVIFILKQYAEYYAYMKQFCQTNQQSIMVAYEELRKSTSEVFAIVLRWLGLPVYYDFVQKAVAFADLRVIQYEEKKRGKPIVGGTKPMAGSTKDGNFVRDGSIGQFKKYLKDRHIEEAAEILDKYDIKLNEFILK